MPGARRPTRARPAATAAPYPDDGRAASGARAAPPPERALRHLLRGLRAGDLETLLLTVAMAADENRMPSADPDEAARILGFLARLAEHDAALPPPEGSGAGPEGPVDGDGAGDGGSDPG
jgi:hypothetical protein